MRAAVARGDVVVSVGGDGMLSHLAGAVSEAGGVLGVLPAGRGNDFARMLGLPGEPDAVARILLEAPERPVDLLRLTAPGQAPRLVAGSVYSGVDARAAEIVDAMRWTPRKLHYPLAAMRAILTYSPGRFRVSVDGSTQEYAAATVVVANSGYYGKGMHIAPDAAVDVEAASRSALVRSFPKIYDGSHVGLDEVHVLRGTRVEVAADGVRPIAVGGDGEPLGTLPALTADPSVVELVPGALRVLS